VPEEGGTGSVGHALGPFQKDREIPAKALRQENVVYLTTRRKAWWLAPGDREERCETQLEMWAQTRLQL
jgi:hypothetical protein